MQVDTPTTHVQERSLLRKCHSHPRMRVEQVAQHHAGRTTTASSAVGVNGVPSHAHTHAHTHTQLHAISLLF